MATENFLGDIVQQFQRLHRQEHLVISDLIALMDQQPFQQPSPEDQIVLSREQVEEMRRGIEFIQKTLQGVTAYFTHSETVKVETTLKQLAETVNTSELSNSVSRLGEVLEKAGPPPITIMDTNLQQLNDSKQEVDGDSGLSALANWVLSEILSRRYKVYSEQDRDAFDELHSIATHMHHVLGIRYPEWED